LAAIVIAGAGAGSGASAVVVVLSESCSVCGLGTVLAISAPFPRQPGSGWLFGFVFRWATTTRYVIVGNRDVEAFDTRRNPSAFPTRFGG
jgi:hypothetical protein